MDFTTNTSKGVLSHTNEHLSFQLNSDALKIYNMYLYIMIVLGVTGNSLVFTVFTKYPPSTTTDWFILFLTTCDFITSLINVPVYATFTNGLWRYYGNDMICKVQMFISQSLVLSSAFLICGLALDRYIKVCRPMTSFSKERARTVCFLISLLTTLLSVPCYTMYGNGYGQCKPVMSTSLFAYYLLVFFIFLFATGVVVFSYTHVTRAIRDSERNVASHYRMKASHFQKIKKSNFKRINKVKPIGASHAESTVKVEDSDNARSSDQDTGRRVTRMKAQVDNIFILSRERNTRISGTPSRDIEPSTSNKVISLLHESSETLTQRSKTTALNQANVAVPEEQMNRKKQMVSLRTTKIAFLVCTLFIVTWIPPWTSFILSIFPGMERNAIGVTFMLFGRMTYLINNMTNPILYTWLNRKFRKNIIEILCCGKTHI